MSLFYEPRMVVWGELVVQNKLAHEALSWPNIHARAATHGRTATKSPERAHRAPRPVCQSSMSKRSAVPKEKDGSSVPASGWPSPIGGPPPPLTAKTFAR